MHQSLLAEWVFRGGMSVWVAYPLMILAVVAVFAVYFRESMKMHIAVRIVMALFRGLALVAIILLLRKPVIVSQDAATKPLPIAVMIDNTQSMLQQDARTSSADLLNAGIAYDILPPDHDASLTPSEEEQIRLAIGNPTRADLVMKAFQNPRLNLREQLRQKGPLQEYFFGAKLVGAGPDWEKKIPASESRTAILFSISELLKRDDNERPAAVVIATDGRENDREHRVPWEDICRECKRLEIPLHIYGVGGGATRLLQLRNLETNPRDTLVAESSVSVTFRWTCRGLDSGTIELNARLGGRVVANKRLDVKEGDEIVETLSFVPEKKDVSAGKVDFEGTIELVGGRNEEKDRIAFPVRVVENKVKVLYVEDTPRWEFKFLLRALQREKIVEPSFVLVNGDEKNAKAGPPFLPAFPKTRKELFAFDMLIIGDVDPAFFTAQQRKWIADFVEDGGGLVMIAGRKHNPAGYVDDPIGKVLPVEFEAKTFPIDDNKRPVEFKPRLGDIGHLESLMSLADTPEENLKIWAELPGWFWHYPVTKLKLTAQSLLDHPTEQIDDPSPLAKDKKRPMPLIARQYYGRGIVLFLASDETWRWRFNEADKYFARFWGQVVYQLGLPRVLGSKSQLVPESDFAKGKPTKIYARLFTPEYLPWKSLASKAHSKNSNPKSARTATSVQAETGRLREQVKGQPGLYVATITKDKPGDYNLKLPLSSTESTQLPIRVIVPPDDELSPGNLNEKALKSIAEQSGGKYYRESDLKDLAKNISGKTVNLNPPPRKEVLLWTRWYVLIGIVALLTVEWLIRKFSSLS